MFPVVDVVRDVREEVPANPFTLKAGGPLRKNKARGFVFVKVNALD
ncbi:hypothetical protein SD77_1497 [Bacillus badius]|uniref:Uncharacterized protein n=1 Tax=Bacillus badius TaxID=1455 RepID=A0ABR5ARW9_BACBA|nr:hypothetical protein SD77_1497 [Bacillus badius]